MRVLKLLVFLLALSIASAVFIYYRPDIMPPGQWHPRSIVYRWRGSTVHPWVALHSDKKYIVTFWDIRWPVFRRELLDYSGYLDYVVQGFMALYPNVRVETRLFDLSVDEDRLWQAIRVGDLPDVVCGPFDPWLVRMNLLSDLTHFFDDEEKARYVPAALSNVTVDGKIWAFPRWLEPDFFMANAALLRRAGIDLEQISSQGWSWAEFTAAMERLKSSNVTPLILNNSGLRAFDTLVGSLGGRSPFDSRGNLSWSLGDLAPTVSLISDLSKRGITCSPPSELQDAMLEHFWSGRAAVIGPVSSGLLRHVRERQQGLIALPEVEKRSEVEIAILPVPSSSGGHVVNAGMLSLMVFKSGDPARMRAAAEFARFLATGRFPKITDALQVVSCYLPVTLDTAQALAAKHGKGWIPEHLRSYARVTQLDTPLSVQTSVNIKKAERALESFWRSPKRPEDLLKAIQDSLRQPLSPPPKKR